MLNAIRAVIEAFLIGFLIGAEREASLGQDHPGIRDFILISLVGAVSGLFPGPWLAVTALASITLLLAVFHFQTAGRHGITTEMAAVAAFFFGYLTTTPHASLAIGISILVVVILEGRQFLHRLVRDTISPAEFNDTLRFLALIFVIYPLLPEGRFGPYQFLSPRTVWLFVILVSSISYVGYFLTKFAGPAKGLALTSILGGLASTTAATAAFARACKEEPAKLGDYLRATLFANAMLSPRVFLILYAVNTDLAMAALPILGAIAAMGFLLGWMLWRRQAGPPPAPDQHVPLRNPLRLLPALELGALFTAILFLGRAAAAVLGGNSAYWTSAVGGLVDTSAVSVALSDLLRSGQITAHIAVAGVLVAWASNALVKILIAVSAGSFAFGWRTAAGFAAMFAAGAAAMAFL
jgi:uncharacterized membrane protein (DUF4010 family)